MDNREVCPWTLTPTGYKGVSEDADTDGCERGQRRPPLYYLPLNVSPEADVEV